MRANIAVSLVIGLLGADLAAGSVCRPQSSSAPSVTNDASLTRSSETTQASASVSTTAESSSATATISVPSSDTAQMTTSAESSSSEVAPESTTTTSESPEAKYTSSAPPANPTFELMFRGDRADGQPLTNDPSGAILTPMLLPRDESFEIFYVYVEEGTGRLRTLFRDYYLCTAYQWFDTADAMPAEVQLCNTSLLDSEERNRLQYITCELEGVNRISCSAPGGYCQTLLEGSEQTEYRRCRLSLGTTFTQFLTRSVNDRDDYIVYLAPDGSFQEYAAIFPRRRN